MNNFDRIAEEIEREARIVGGQVGIDPQVLQTLVLELVDLEDQNLRSRIQIQKRFAERITSASSATATVVE